MTEVKLTSEEYRQLYNVYTYASAYVNHKDEFDLDRLNEWHRESKKFNLEEAVKQFKDVF
jgi:hypothetical protein